MRTPPGLQALIDDGIIDAVLRPLKSGKEAAVYVVQRGDTLFGIAVNFQVDMQALMALNGITNPDRVDAGVKLTMPPATGFVAVAPSTTMLP